MIINPYLFAPSIDPDAQAFITAAAITDPTQQSAINQLVVDLKGYSIWTKFKAIYPIVGGTASSHKWNLKDPRDLDAAFRLTFATGWTHSANGMTPNGATYADTKLNPNSALTLNSTHLSFYSRTNVSAVQREIAVYQSGDNPTMAIGTNSGDEISDHYNYNQRISASIVSSTGFYIGTRTSSTSHKLYKNNTTLGTNTSTNVNSLPNGNVFIGASNNTTLGIITAYSTKECAFASIGDGLTDAEAANFYTAVQAFQTTLGRSIGTQTVSDADAQAFVTAANITDQVEANAINDLVIGMKADGLWTKMKAIYPIVGGVASSHAVNLKTPGTYNLTFGTGWTHNANGMTSLNTFAQTGIQPSTVLGLDDAHLSYFTTGFDSSATCMIGAYTAPNRLAIYSAGYYGVNSASWSTYTYSGGTQKFRVISRLSSTVHKFANNGTIQTGTLNSSVRPTANIELARLGGATDYFNGICKFASVGDGLTDTDIANFNTRVTTYQTALNRYN